MAHKLALINGLTQLGVPYKINAATENVAFDCSGLVAFAWGKVQLGSCGLCTWVGLKYGAVFST